MREINRIVVHHTVTAPDATVEDIDRMHRARGFSKIGYHFLVRPDGAHVGRAVTRMGAHAKGHNRDSIGVSCVGNYSEGPHSSDVRRVLLGLLKGLCDGHGLGADDVYGHRELAGAATECPGLLVDMDEVRAQLRGML